MSQAQVARIDAFGVQLDKVRNELVTEFAALRAQVETATDDPAVTAALDRFGAKVQAVDDIVPDPVEQPPAGGDTSARPPADPSDAAMATDDDPPGGLVAMAQALHLAPGDTLVLHMEHWHQDQTLKRMRQQLEERFPDNKVLVLDGGATLSTISPAGGQLDRIEAMLGQLLESLADDEEEEPGQDLDGGPSGRAREPGTPL